MLLASLSIYNSSAIFLNKSRINTHILLSIVFLIIAILTYEMYAVYYLVGILFLVLLYKVFPYNIKCKYNKNTFRSICWTSFILAFSIIIYKILMYLVLILLNITKDNYTENYICWSKSNFINIIYSLVSYAFRLFTHNYNFYISVTVLFGIIFMAFLSLKYRKKSLFLNFIVTLFLFSPFSLSIVFGNGGMPYRTLNALPLMLAGISFLLYSSLKNNLAKKLIISVVLVSTFFNAQYTTRLFYGDNMCLKYDVYYAQKIYSDILGIAGNTINKKPLAIIGKPPFPQKPFILKSKYDVMGVSFFSWGSYKSVHYFMSWTGNDFILPSTSQYESAINISFNMPNYPEKGSIKETKDLIILKLFPPK